MALQQKNIQTQNVQLFVAAAPTVAGTNPGNLVATDTYIECILELSSLSQTRATETYNCMSSGASMTSAGTIEKDALTLKTLYSEDAGGNGGFDFVKNAFETNTEIAVLIQFDNGTSPYDDVAGGTGTGIWSDAIITKFEMVFEKDKLIEASFELNYQGIVNIVPAT